MLSVVGVVGFGVKSLYKEIHGKSFGKPTTTHHTHHSPVLSTT
jgi:hypothetical protein